MREVYDTPPRGAEMTTSDLRMPPSICRVTILTKDASGQLHPTVIYQRGGAKKKQSAKLKPIESLVRRVAETAAAPADSYLERHRDSNAKERDGWLVNLQGNVFKAVRTGSKHMKMNRAMS